MQNWLEVYPEYIQLRDWFVKEKFQLVEEHHDDYSSVIVVGERIRGCFCTPNDVSYQQLSGRFAADNEECFAKWSKCPLIMKIPCDLDELKKHIKFLGSPEGYKHSNGYEYLDERILPCEMDYD